MHLVMLSGNKIPRCPGCCGLNLLAHLRSEGYGLLSMQSVKVGETAVARFKIVQEKGKPAAAKDD